MKKQNGFSLIELLIVVVIIGIVAAIAIPNLLVARSSANEGSAISAMRSLHSAQMTYQGTVGAGRFAGDISNSSAALTGLLNANLIDGVLGSGAKSGYVFVGGKSDPTTGANAEPAQFWFSAVPSITSGSAKTGQRRIGVSTNGVLKADATSIDTHFANVAEIVLAPGLNN